MPKVPGQNPIEFNTLDDYIYYIKVQRYKYGQYCPVLYLQQESDAQGQDVYRVRPGPFDQQGGLSAGAINPKWVNYFQGNLATMGFPPQQPGPVPFNVMNAASVQPPLIPPHPPLVTYRTAVLSNPPYNQGFLGFDPQGEYIGKYTVLDQVHYSTRTQNPDGLSSNAMDPNWAGAQFTNEQLKALDDSLQANISSFSSSPSASPSSFSGVVMKNEPANTIFPGSYATPSVSPQFPFGASTATAPIPGPGASPSANPMDANWGGSSFAQSQIDAGVFAGNEVSIAVA
jgi:hypothetical protein